MIPIIPFLAWTGGVAAGAQVAGGIARGVGKLVRGQPISAVVQVADGLVAPVRTACHELWRLGSDICNIVLENWDREQDAEPSQPVPARRPSLPRRNLEPTENGSPLVNRVVALITRS